MKKKLESARILFEQGNKIKSNNMNAYVRLALINALEKDTISS